MGNALGNQVTRLQDADSPRPAGTHQPPTQSPTPVLLKVEERLLPKEEIERRGHMLIVGGRHVRQTWTAGVSSASYTRA